MHRHARMSRMRMEADTMKYAYWFWAVITAAMTFCFFYESYTGWHEFHDLFFGIAVLISLSTATIMLGLYTIESKLKEK